jgi:hypothetical protein
VPKVLTQRLQPDSIAQFRDAARMRHEDASQLARSNRGLAAIYLWGYVAEMTVKAAYFATSGLSDTDPIGRREFQNAELQAQSLGIHWSSGAGLHRVSQWAELLIQYRKRSGRPYSLRFAADVLEHSSRIQARWRVDMRYKRNIAYQFEVQAVAESAEWFLTHSREL